MKANYTIDAGDLRVIRPLVTCREILFKEFAEKAQLPVITDNCPACFSAPKERHRVKLMLAQQEHLFPDLFQTILKTISPLMRSNLKQLIESGALGGAKAEEEEDDDTGKGETQNEGEDSDELIEQSMSACGPTGDSCPL